MLEDMNQLPNRLRSHSVYDEFKDQLMSYRKTNALFLDLKSEAMKPRHWKTLLSKLKIKEAFNDITLGHLWQANLLKNVKALNEIMS